MQPGPGKEPSPADAGGSGRGGENAPVHGAHQAAPTELAARQYWSANVRLLLTLLAVWFAVSFGAGILFVEPLNAVKLGGYPLGFWFAQQGSILTFVVLIFVYTMRMRAIERRFGVDDE